jgi:heme peroxidase
MKQTGQNHHGDSNDSSAFDNSDSAQGDLGGGTFHGTSYRPIGGGDTVPPGATELRLAPADFTTQPVGSDPNPRTISANIAGFNGLGDTLEDPMNSAWLYVLGQFVDHDIDKEVLNPAVNVDVTVPAGDPNFPAGTIIPLGGSAGPNAVNTVAGYLDLSQVYGSDEATDNSLRNADGTMKEGPGGSPPVVNGAFVSGDVRVGENPELSGVTALFIREHNFWVGQLQQAHPNWTGDQLYEAARAITTAEYEHVITSEFLPALIGTDLGPYRGYDPNVNPNVSMEFSTVAFRVGHSQVSGTQTRIDNDGNVVATQSLADAFFDTPAQSAGADNFNALLRNLSADPSQATDPFSADVLRNALSAPPQLVDLIAIDIQRQRDLGLGTLNETRQALGFAPYTSFAQLSSDPTIQALYQQTYGSIDNVDAFMGGLAEDHAPGAAVGPTFQAIIEDQFQRMRDGDAYWWQNQNLPQDIQNIVENTTLGDILARNTSTPALQQQVFIAAERHLSTVAPEDPDASQLVIGVDDNGAVIAGGPADDTIVAGAGLSQVLTGNGGVDTFVFIDGNHSDTISDFDPAHEKIQFTTSAPPTLADMTGTAHISVSDFPLDGHHTGALVSFGGNQIVLAGVSATDLSAANFIVAPGERIVVDHGNGCA